MKQLLNHKTHAHAHNQNAFLTGCHHLAIHVATEEKRSNQTNQNRHNTVYIVYNHNACI